MLDNLDTAKLAALITTEEYLDNLFPFVARHKPGRVVDGPFSHMLVGLLLKLSTDFFQHT